ncbi:MAG TPA: hypothetical protein VMV38_02170, partial [Candidatus Paceibacterota bacterium]|nr:hypothetical protein [Candidatus Paceibacterota bacterium]
MLDERVWHSLVFKKEKGEAMKNKEAQKKPVLAKKKHHALLKDTGFAGCIPCCGCTGKLENGHLLCSHAGAKPGLVSESQAQRCDGTNPRLSAKLAKKSRRTVTHAVP